MRANTLTVVQQRNVIAQKVFRSFIHLRKEGIKERMEGEKEHKVC
jgi:hypothetical protein